MTKSSCQSTKDWAESSGGRCSDAGRRACPALSGSRGIANTVGNRSLLHRQRLDARDPGAIETVDPKLEVAGQEQLLLALAILIGESLAVAFEIPDLLAANLRVMYAGSLLEPSIAGIVVSVIRAGRIAAPTSPSAYSPWQ